MHQNTLLVQMHQIRQQGECLFGQGISTGLQPCPFREGETNDSEMALRDRGVDNSGVCAGTVLECRTKSGKLAGTVLNAQQDWTTFRANYDAMMSNFERMAAATGNKARQERAHQGREAMRLVTDDQLTKTFAQNHVPDLSFGATASQYLAAQMESQQKAAETNRALSPLTPGFPARLTRRRMRWGGHYRRHPIRPFHYQGGCKFDPGRGRLGLQRGHPG